MLTWFPIPYPGESLYSMLARYHERSGNYLPRDSMGQLFGDRREVCSALIPYRLEHLAEQTARFGLDFNTLLHMYTLYDYYLLFASQKNRNRVQEILHENLGQAYDRMLGNHSRKQFPDFLRFCPQCAKEEEKRYGEAYWHNTHQIPGMCFCEKHGCSLVNSTVSTVSHGKKQLYVPLSAVCHIFEQPKYDETMQAKLRILSQELYTAWENRKRIRAQWERMGETFSDSYVELASKKRLATECGTVRRALLVQAVSGMFTQEMLDFVGASITKGKPWPVTMCQHSSVIHAPLNNILLMIFLCGGVEEFLKYEEELKKAPAHKKNDCYSTVTDEERLAPYREKWMQLLKEHPQASRNELIQKMPSVHLWLRRHDRNWLMEHYPEPRKRGMKHSVKYNWKQRDEAYVQRIRHLNDSWRRETGKPCRITKNRFYHALGLSEVMIEKIPRSKALILDCVEDNKSWDLRRIRWAIRTMQENGEPLIAWRVIRKAGIGDIRRKQWTAFLTVSGWLELEENVLGEASGNGI